MVKGDNVGAWSYLFDMKLTPELSIVIALAIALLAFWLGRNFFIWFALAYFLPIPAVILLIIRQAKAPRKQVHWLNYQTKKFKRKFGLDANESSGDADPDKPAL